MAGRDAISSKLHEYGSARSLPSLLATHVVHFTFNWIVDKTHLNTVKILYYVYLQPSWYIVIWSSQAQSKDYCIDYCLSEIFVIKKKKVLVKVIWLNLVHNESLTITYTGLFVVAAGLPQNCLAVCSTKCVPVVADKCQMFAKNCLPVDANCSVLPKVRLLLPLNRCKHLANWHTHLS